MWPPSSLLSCKQRISKILILFSKSSLVKSNLLSYLMTRNAAWTISRESSSRPNRQLRPTSTTILPVVTVKLAIITMIHPRIKTTQLTQMKLISCLRPIPVTVEKKRQKWLRMVVSQTLMSLLSISKSVITKPQIQKFWSLKELWMSWKTASLANREFKLSEIRLRPS